VRPDDKAHARFPVRPSGGPVGARRSGLAERGPKVDRLARKKALGGGLRRLPRHGGRTRPLPVLPTPGPARLRPDDPLGCLFLGWFVGLGPPGPGVPPRPLRRGGGSSRRRAVGRLGPFVGPPLGLRAYLSTWG